MRKKNWSFKEAITFVRQSRPSVLPNLGFERQLKEYEIFLNRQAEFGFERRMGSKTSEERKHVPEKVLPEIGVLGRTQLKPRLLELFAAEPEKILSQQRSRKSNYTRDN